MLQKIRAALQSFRTFSELIVEEREFEATATGLLKGHVFHATAAHCLPQIVAAGAVHPNRSGELRSPFSQSKNSYGVRRGYICLFDFRDHNDQFITSAFEIFLSAAVPKFAHRPVFLVLNPSSYERLITSQTAQRETGGRELWVPYVECWHPAAIPLDLIDSAILMRVKRRPFDGSLAAHHARAIESAWRKRRLQTRKRQTEDH